MGSPIPPAIELAMPRDDAPILLATVRDLVALSTMSAWWVGLSAEAIAESTRDMLAGMLRAEWAYLAGYAVQVAAIGLGLVVPVMFALGAVFAALWAAADLLGRKIERERAEAWANWRAEQAQQD